MPDIIEAERLEILHGDQAVAEGEGQRWGAPRPLDNARYLADLNEAAILFGNAMAGNRLAMLNLAEALSKPDFPNLLGGVFERELQAEYEDLAPVWRTFLDRTTVRDFRAKTMIDLLGGKAALEAVKPGAPYPARTVTESTNSISVAKYGARFALLWEAIVNDDLDGLRRLPGALAQAALDTEDRLGTGVLAIATGPNTAFFKTANGNAPTALPLTTDNLSAALTAVTSRKDTDGRPIAFPRGFKLVVPPALETAGRNILGATEIRVTEGSNELRVGNWLTQKVALEVNPWLSVVDVSAKTDTTWYLMPTPGGRRPAGWNAFLRGHETPDIRTKADAGQRVGGGPVPAGEGSFDADDVQYRVRHVVGAAAGDPKGTYASTGS